MSQISNDLLLAARAAVEAGEAIIKIYNQDIKVEYKEDNSPLTIADKKANDIIMRHLRHSPIPVISEENKQISYDERKNWNQCWVVDPLDGTKEFIKRNGEFTVNIALVENGSPILGVIYVPVIKTLYLGDTLNKQALKIVLDAHHFAHNDLMVKSEQLSPGSRSGDTIRIVGSRSHMSKETTAFIEGFKKDYDDVQIVSKGSSLKFCLVAEGLADVYPRFAPTMEWDTAAGQAICSAAGVIVISEETQEELRYNKENLLNPWFIVG